MTTATKPAIAPGRYAFLLRPLRQAPRLVPEKPGKRVPRPLAPRQGRQGAPEARHRQDQDAARPAARLPLRHRAGLRHRRLRDGDVDHAGSARRRCAGLGELRRGLGDRRHQAAQAQGPAHHRRPSTASCPTSRKVDFSRDVLFTWNGTTVGRARAERRLDPRQPRGPDLRGCHLRRASRRTSPGTRSMCSPTPGRRCWAARRRTAC